MQSIMPMKRLKVWNSLYCNKSMTLLGKTCYKILPLPFIMVQAIIGLKLIQEAGQEHTKRV